MPKLGRKIVRRHSIAITDVEEYIIEGFRDRYGQLAGHRRDADFLFGVMSGALHALAEARALDDKASIWPPRFTLETGNPEREAKYQFQVKLENELDAVNAVIACATSSPPPTA